MLFPRFDRARVVALVLWPIAVVLVPQRSVILGVNGSRTDDFAPVYRAALAFLRRESVYIENYANVDPHYLYPPSGSLVMAPLGYLDPERARWLFIAASALALVGCAVLLVRMFGYSLSSPVMPGTLLAMFMTESVANTLIFVNFNSFVLLGQLVFMTLMLRRKDWWAGVPLGLTLAVKPVLGVLLLLPLLNRQWKVFAGAFAVPAVLTAAAWPVAVDPDAFVRRTVPYLLEVRDYYNSSLSGYGVYFGVDHWLVLLLRITFVGMAAFGVWFLYRHYRTSNELLWLTTTSGVLLGTSFLVLSLGQGYYSMLLFPLLMTVLLPGSVMKAWPAWLGVYGCLSFDTFASQRWEAFGRILEYSKVTWGWSLLMANVFFVLLFRHLDVRRLERTTTPRSPQNPENPREVIPHV
ncbi:glycosyltransferase family 87 protein [Williamsia sp. 1135]|uniref:glycosyltransferase family 87 protein n=1 Tax=Williamsia sp. 1135 TaxID=1889262 RepID=UPI001F0B2B83|nr:glycosyltransferase family 87 protein [Williamsia sp. 1135]